MVLHTFEQGIALRQAVIRKCCRSKLTWAASRTLNHTYHSTRCIHNHLVRRERPRPGACGLRLRNARMYMRVLMWDVHWQTTKKCGSSPECSGMQQTASRRQGRSACPPGPARGLSCGVSCSRRHYKIVRALAISRGRYVRGMAGASRGRTRPNQAYVRMTGVIHDRAATLVLGICIGISQEPPD